MQATDGKVMGKQKPLHATFVDLKKLCNTILRSKVRYLMERMVPEKRTRVMQVIHREERIVSRSFVGIEKFCD